MIDLSRDKVTSAPGKSHHQEYSLKLEQIAEGGSSSHFGGDLWEGQPGREMWR